MSDLARVVTFGVVRVLLLGAMAAGIVAWRLRRR